GHFDHAGGPNPPPVSTYNVARWNGSTWSALNLGLGSPPAPGGYRNDAYTLIPFDGMLVAGGGFYNVAGGGLNGIAQWNGSNWQEVPGVVHDLGVIHAMTVFDGTVVTGGDFGMVESRDSQIGYNMSRWDGLALSAGLGDGGGTNGPVNALKSFVTGS